MERKAVRDLTIGICHSAYQIEPAIRERVSGAHVFQESDTSAIKPRMPEVDVLVISGAWHNSLLEHAAHLKWIQSIGVGFDQFPLDQLKRLGIPLTNAAGVNAGAAGEHAMALILALARRLPEARDNQRRRRWRPMISDPDAREDEVSGKTVGIVGLGAIGNRVAGFAKAFGMRVIGVKGNPAAYQGLADEVLPPKRLGELLDVADYAVLCCPLKPETTRLIGAAELKAMRRSAFLVNVARGPVVVEADLIAALRAGEIAGAALDVTVDEPLMPDSPLWDMPEVLITPHTAGETRLYERRLADIVAENVLRWERGEPFINRVL